VFVYYLKYTPSREGDVSPHIFKMEVIVGESGYVFNFKVNKERSLIEVSSRWADVKRVIDGKVFGEINKVYLRGVQIVARTSNSSGPQAGVIIVVPYSPEYIDKKNES
jgi:hypothetical protein